MHSGKELPKEIESVVYSKMGLFNREHFAFFMSLNMCVISISECLSFIANEIS